MLFRLPFNLVVFFVLESPTEKCHANLLVRTHLSLLPMSLQAHARYFGFPTRYICANFFLFKYYCRCPLKHVGRDVNQQWFSMYAVIDFELCIVLPGWSKVMLVWWSDLYFVIIEKWELTKTVVNYNENIGKENGDTRTYICHLYGNIHKVHVSMAVYIYLCLRLYNTYMYIHEQ